MATLKITKAAKSSEDAARGRTLRGRWDQDGELVVGEVQEVLDVLEAMPREALGPGPGDRALKGREGVGQRRHDKKGLR